MDKQEAKLTLQARRLSDRDAAQADFAEALALVENDPELKMWWEAQQSFDRIVATKLEEIPIPADLRSTILAGRKTERLAPQPHILYWLAAAAMIAILCVAGTLRQNQRYGPLSQDDFATVVIPLLKNDSPSLAILSPEHDKIVNWLKAEHAPMGKLPVRMNDMPMVGCQKYMVHGHAVSLVCFSMADGRIAHLFIVEQTALTDPPRSTLPEYRPLLGWSTASWSDGRMSYLLVSADTTDALRQLL